MNLRDQGHLERQRQTFHLALTALILLAVTTAPPLVANKASERRLSFYNINTKENSEVVYKRYGQWVPGAKEKIDWIMRDWRQDKATSMNKELIDTLWEIHTELGSREPIHLISAYRSPKTNEMLRKTRGGQARKSRHMLGLAADVHFPDVPVKRLRYSALVRERGGVGYYPTSAIPFVHIDTGRVRHWPRMTRTELALLFPNGDTKHRPTDGRPITRRDYVAAKQKNQQLAMEVAAFHRFRRSPRVPQPTLVAENRFAPVDKTRSPLALAGRDVGQSAWNSQVTRASRDIDEASRRPAPPARYAALTPPAPLAPGEQRLRAPAPKLAERPPRPRQPVRIRLQLLVLEAVRLRPGHRQRKSG